MSQKLKIPGWSILFQATMVDIKNDDLAILPNMTSLPELNDKWN